MIPSQLGVLIFGGGFRSRVGCGSPLAKDVKQQRSGRNQQRPNRNDEPEKQPTHHYDQPAEYQRAWLRP